MKKPGMSSSARFDYKILPLVLCPAFLIWKIIRQTGPFDAVFPEQTYGIGMNNVFLL